MPKDYARILLQRHGENGLAAYDCDSQQQILMFDEYATQNHNDRFTFLMDCIDLTQATSTRYDKGYAIAVGMAADNWAQWLSAYPNAGIDDVWLTVERESQLGDAISALCLTDKREAVVMSDSAAFIGDCKGWNERTFENEQSFVVRMKAENWALWLSVWEALTAEHAA